MLDTVISGVKITLRYEKGAYTYARLRPDASDASLYEAASALNSLQKNRAKSIIKTVTRKIIDLG